MLFNVRRAHYSVVTTSVLTFALFGAASLNAQQNSEASNATDSVRKSIVDGRYVDAVDGRYVDAPESSSALPEYLKPTVRLKTKNNGGKKKARTAKEKVEEKKSATKTNPEPESSQTKTAKTEPEQQTTPSATAAAPTKSKSKLEKSKRDKVTRYVIEPKKSGEQPQKIEQKSTTAALDNGEPAADEALTVTAPPPADPIIEAVRGRLQEKVRFKNDNKDDVAALSAFYNARTTPVWIDEAGTNKAALSIINEINRAEDWGLNAGLFRPPTPVSSNATTQNLAQFELNLARNFLRYARFAKGGRTNPRRLSRILDYTPPVKDPAIVLAKLAETSEPDAYLRGLHPQHEQFKRLRKALLRARGPVQPEKTVAPVVLLSRTGPSLAIGSKHSDVARLRQRLKVPAALGQSSHYFDDLVAKALRTYQKKTGLKATGKLTRKTRRSLSRPPARKTRVRGKGIEQRLLINMEKWRWIAEDLGEFHVWDNVPEFAVRVMKNGKQIWRERIIVGQPEWPTPALSSKIEHTIFYPSWGVPNGIKQRELLPRIRKASKPKGLFDALFSGGYNGGASVIKAYKLTVYQNGRLINPNSVNWSTANIHAYSFIQPPGGSNPLGVVKFTFPNKYTVYMHDTIEPELFAKSRRTLSHGCLRVRNPRKLAELLYRQDKGASEGAARAAARRGTSFKLKNPVPVHITYFTALIDDDGKLQTFSDIYGHDRRVARAILGKGVRFRDPPRQVSRNNDIEEQVEPAPRRRKKTRKKKRTVKKKTPPASNYKMPSSISEAVAGNLSY